MGMLMHFRRQITSLSSEIDVLSISSPGCLGNPSRLRGQMKLRAWTDSIVNIPSCFRTSTSPPWSCHSLAILKQASNDEQGRRPIPHSYQPRAFRGHSDSRFDVEGEVDKHERNCLRLIRPEPRLLQCWNFSSSTSPETLLRSSGKPRTNNEKILSRRKETVQDQGHSGQQHVQAQGKPAQRTKIRII